MEATGTVTAVVLNYDGRHLLEVILPSLATQTYAPLEVLVVDNGSRDDSLAWLADHWPDVEVLRIETNIGVAAALNRGVGAARGEYVALLNNDLELEPAWVTELVDALARHPEAASAACKLRSYHRRDRLDGAGDILTRAITGNRRGLDEVDHGQYDDAQEVFAPTAGAALYRASAFARVGLFDESFFAYLEDVDWGLRARLLGLACRYVPTAVGYHMGSATTRGDANPHYWMLARRNQIGVMVKDVPLRLLIRHVFPIALEHVAGFLDTVRRRRPGAYVEVVRQVVPRLPGWLADRRRIQRGRLISVDELDAMLVGSGLAGRIGRRLRSR
ncbi:MAG TPA: glycosyltransferase family 2 protein [Solirubrobacteraceae bacterium]|nr:glycosyltransferase family 2 protein [Solirubrobacteraceae bacterium]